MTVRRARHAECTPPVSIVVVTHGARDMTLRCLDSIAEEAVRDGGEVIVVDNGSGNGLATEIAARHPHFCVLPLAANLGFAGAANLGGFLARGQMLLFLNPDTLIPPGAVRRLLDFACLRPAAGIWGGRTIYDDGATNPHSNRRFASLWSLFCSALALDTRFPGSPLFASMGYGGWQRNSERCVEVVCGCFFLIDRLVWERIGGFSPAFYMYGEDDDLCLRARRLGYRPAFTPEASIIHYGSGTEPRQDRKISQIFASRALLIRGYFPFLGRPLARFFLALRPFLGRFMAKPVLRPVWSSVWTQRRHWLSGRFVS